MTSPRAQRMKARQQVKDLAGRRAHQPRPPPSSEDESSSEDDAEMVMVSKGHRRNRTRAFTRDTARREIETTKNAFLPSFRVNKKNDKLLAKLNEELSQYYHMLDASVGKKHDIKVMVGQNSEKATEMKTKIENYISIAKFYKRILALTQGVGFKPEHTPRLDMLQHVLSEYANYEEDPSAMNKTVFLEQFGKEFFFTLREPKTFSLIEGAVENETEEFKQERENMKELMNEEFVDIESAEMHKFRLNLWNSFFFNCRKDVKTIFSGIEKHNFSQLVSAIRKHDRKAAVNNNSKLHQKFQDLKLVQTDNLSYDWTIYSGSLRALHTQFEKENENEGISDRRFMEKILSDHAKIEDIQNIWIKLLLASGKTPEDYAEVTNPITHLDQMERLVRAITSGKELRDTGKKFSGEDETLLTQMQQERKDRKNQPCFNMRKKGTCKFGQNCVFSHDPKVLRKGAKSCESCAKSPDRVRISDTHSTNECRFSSQNNSSENSSGKTKWVDPVNDSEDEGVQTMLTKIATLKGPQVKKILHVLKREEGVFGSTDPDTDKASKRRHRKREGKGNGEEGLVLNITGESDSSDYETYEAKPRKPSEKVTENFAENSFKRFSEQFSEKP